MSRPETPNEPARRPAVPASSGELVQGDGFPRTVDEARTDLELTRAELGATARELAHRLNVADRARDEFHARSRTVLAALRANPVSVSAAAGTLALLLGGAVTWRLRRSPGPNGSAGSRRQARAR